MPRKKGPAKRRGRPTQDDEITLLEMARETLTGRQAKDWRLAGEAAERVEAAPRARPAARSRLYRKFRKRKEELVQKVQAEDANPEQPVPSGENLETP